MVQQFIIEKNEYLHQNIQAFYRCDYVGYQNEGNPDYINTLKNTFNSTSDNELKRAIQLLTENLHNELIEILKNINQENMVICVVPRAKSEQTYSQKQLLFKSSIQKVIIDLQNNSVPIIDGSNFILRHTNTCTTHLAKSRMGGGDGEMPYIGITQDTCTISHEVAGKNILLIDDIYTKSVNIDEDCIQALLDNGAKNVYFFAIARTKLRERGLIFNEEAKHKFINSLRLRKDQLQNRK